MTSLSLAYEMYFVCWLLIYQGMVTGLSFFKDRLALRTVSKFCCFLGKVEDGFQLLKTLWSYHTFFSTVLNLSKTKDLWEDNLKQAKAVWQSSREI